MNTFTLIITAISGSGAYACLFAGYVALISLDQNEIEEFKRRYRELSPLLRWLWTPRERLPLSQITAHWRTRSNARRLIYTGLILLVVALIAGHFSTLPK